MILLGIHGLLLIIMLDIYFKLMLMKYRSFVVLEWACQVLTYGNDICFIYFKSYSHGLFLAWAFTIHYPLPEVFGYLFF